MIDEQWLANKEKEDYVIVGNQIQVFKNPEGELRLTYSENCKLGIYPAIDYTKDEYTYRLIADFQLDGDIQLVIQISLYYTNSSTMTYTYEESAWRTGIEVASEGIQTIYLTLWIKGIGKITCNRLALKVHSQKRLNEKHIKYKGVIEKLGQEKSRALQKTDEPQKQKKRLKIATILDEMSEACFQYEASIMQLEANNWREQLQSFTPHMLLVESAWQGKKNSWIGKIACVNKHYDETVYDLICYCKEEGIPTVFWDKEGIQNFHYFIGTASLFDYVGVTDERLLPMHEAIHSHDSVFILPFAAQPRLHYKRHVMDHFIGQVAFAGAWYGDKYPARLKGITNILEPAKKFDLTIYDRNYRSGLEAYQWPTGYEPYIVGAVSYQEMVQLYSYYPIFINIQSITKSKWMLARRVYELLASEVIVISSESDAILHQFQDVIFVAKSPKETTTILTSVLDNLDAWQGMREIAKKEVLQKHTYRHRLETILEVVGIKEV